MMLLITYILILSAFSCCKKIVQNIGITLGLLLSCHIHNVELPYLGDVKAMHIAIGLLIPG